jgi:hypothetical protein
MMPKNALIVAALLAAASVQPLLAQSQPPGIPCDAFRKTQDGGWTALRDLSIRTRNGPIVLRPGSSFREGDRLNDIDLGKILKGRCS